MILINYKMTIYIHIFVVLKQPKKYIIMKTKLILSFLLLFCISTATYANTRETITLSNIEKTERGCIKEFLNCDSETSAPLSKTIYNYDIEGRLLEKEYYKWSAKLGWVGTQKYSYYYDGNNQLLTPSVSKWDIKNKCWLTTK